MSDHNHKDDLSNSESVDSLACSHEDTDSHRSSDDEERYSGEQNDLPAQGKEEVKEDVPEKGLAQFLPSKFIEHIAFNESPMPVKEEETKKQEEEPSFSSVVHKLPATTIIPNISVQPK
eukprot:CAMPEP_0170494044 /NCGR_PEP_ID=MMETSP0208-20121228/14410_1 /TAXON_ID=197538 /ORGANISM="Strombidium inclinatum, Strain S3" /LENGTH=118 /DNA_ID=CAMNT_0010770035 /DNA_START=43 /DNA_END=399 /DNA_ORIENTATION=+